MFYLFDVCINNIVKLQRLYFCVANLQIYQFYQFSLTASNPNNYCFFLCRWEEASLLPSTSLTRPHLTVKILRHVTPVQQGARRKTWTGFAKKRPVIILLIGSESSEQVLSVRLCRPVGLSVIISKKGGKFHLHTPIGTRFLIVWHSIKFFL